jgi:hypothetical protein
MHNTWNLAFKELEEYIHHNPSIEIKMDCIIIPGDVRAEFYRLFNSVCASFIQEKFREAMDKSSVLSQKWDDLSQALINTLKLESIDIHSKTRLFLVDPIYGLVHTLFDPLFNVFQGKIDLVTFEKTAIEMAENEFNRLYREGYQRWAALSIIKALAADKVFKVLGPDSYNEVNLLDSSMGISVLDGDVPDPVEASDISFTQAPDNAFVVAKIIVHSARLNAFVAIRPDIFEAPWLARYRSDKLEWYDIKTLERKFGKNHLWPDLALYIAEEKNALSLIADCRQIARPDVIIECRETSDWYDKEGLDKIKQHYDMLKPKLGSFVICCEPVPAKAVAELQPKPKQPALSDPATAAPEAIAVEQDYNIHLLDVNYDISQLEPVLKAITRAQAGSNRV